MAMIMTIKVMITLILLTTMIHIRSTNKMPHGRQGAAPAHKGQADKLRSTPSVRARSP